jgi:hypothetical protein
LNFLGADFKYLMQKTTMSKARAIFIKGALNARKKAVQ